ISNVGFHDVDYHSGEPFDNTDWGTTVAAGSVLWHSPQTFAQNPNTNALRWGTLYNFRFDATAAPQSGSVTLGLFKPGTPSSVTAAAVVPAGTVCPCDWNHSGGINSEDFFSFVTDFLNINADYNGDGVTNTQDFFAFLACFFNACH